MLCNQESEIYMNDKKTTDIPNSENNSEMPEQSKKKISKREIFRRVMLSICICALAYFLVQFVIIIGEYIQARQVSGELTDGLGSITKPADSTPQGSVPVIVTPATEPETSEPSESDPDSSETPSDDPELVPPEHVYSEYFSQWLEYIRATKKKYPDLIGYIEIENLNILYPIVQSEDNDYYLTHLIDGSKNSRGEIFLDYRNNGENILENKNIVLYGHNLADGTKFHNLTSLRKEENYYNSPINIITEDGIFTFTIFSFYKTDKDNLYTKLNFSSNQNLAVFCYQEQGLSMHASNFTFTGKEVILTLSTCVNDMGGRWCTHAVLTNISQ